MKKQLDHDGYHYGLFQLRRHWKSHGEVLHALELVTVYGYMCFIISNNEFLLCANLKTPYCRI